LSFDGRNDGGTSFLLPSFLLPSKLTPVSFEEEHRVNRLLTEDPFCQLLQFQTASPVIEATVAIGATLAYEPTQTYGVTVDNTSAANASFSPFSAYAAGKPHTNGMKQLE
jgi:hypothetical protein